MPLKKATRNKWIRRVSNKYVLIALIFIVWMLFFDANSFLVHRELNQEVKELESNKTYFEKEIQKDKEYLEKLKQEDELEKFARERYFLKKENEEIFIIEHEDSIKNNTP